MSSTLAVAGHQLTLLRNGEEYFPHLLAAIAAAQHSIHLETYIFAADQEGRWVAEALQQAARRGVRVHVLLDGFGSAALPDGWVERMRSAGVTVLWFRQELGRFNFRRHRLRRLHRKLVVVDGRLGFVGGINIISDISPGMHAPRLDFAVEVSGPVVHDMHAAARRLWALVSWSQLRRRGDRDALPRQLKSDTRQKVAFLLRDNLRHRRDIERAYLKAIGQAQYEIVLANAYFLPGRKFRQALVSAAARGVRVVLLLQGRVDHPLQHYACRALYGQLLQAGIEINEYHASLLHAKVAVVDGQWATVGSSNIDPFSLLLAREGNLVVRDAEFAGALRASLLAALEAGAQRIHVDHWQGLPLWSRLLTWVSYGVVRLLAGWSGYIRAGEEI
ncbi:cardiolipin synthase ClsB [Ferriphaselus sp. R-1]|uniref:cardiolipin synthase ClsB n=1 Tax=Ferriphaselus sp. R-1 TaxID=1485544 RepID=UPI0005573594|nr:cardiolipin synthase ClsB [Ferriphaselus sp. R-1]